MIYYVIPMTNKKRLDRRLSIRMDESQWERLEQVAKDIALTSRGQKPDLSEIIRAIIGWGNRDLVTPEEKAFLAGDIPSLHGPHVPKRNKP